MSSNLEVAPFDSALRFKVTSNSRAEIEHIVDLGAMNGNGECSCEHFQFRMLPEVRSMGKVCRCAHINAARQTLADMVIEKLTRITS